MLYAAVVLVAQRVCDGRRVVRRVVGGATVRAEAALREVTHLQRDVHGHAHRCRERKQRRLAAERDTAAWLVATAAGVRNSDVQQHSGMQQRGSWRMVGAGLGQTTQRRSEGRCVTNFNVTPSEVQTHTATHVTITYELLSPLQEAV